MSLPEALSPAFTDQPAAIYSPAKTC